MASADIRSSPPLALLRVKMRMHELSSRDETPAAVSAIVVCFNEEDRIEVCLQSLAWCAEIIVVDSYSTDRTPEICRLYTDRFIQREWAGYRDQKAFAHSQATKEWVLLVDSDERVTPELRDEIVEALTRDGGQYCGYAVPRLVRYLERWWWRGGWYPDYDVRLFRHDRASWGGSDPHEKILVDGPVRRLRHPLEHYSYRSIEDHVQRINRFTSISSRELKKAGIQWRLGDGTSSSCRSIFPFIFLKARIHGRLCRFLCCRHGRRLCFSQIC